MRWVVVTLVENRKIASLTPIQRLTKPVNEILVGGLSKRICETLLSGRLRSSAPPFPIGVAEAAITSVTDAETVKNNSGLRNNNSLALPQMA